MPHEKTKRTFLMVDVILFFIILVTNGIICISLTRQLVGMESKSGHLLRQNIINSIHIKINKYTNKVGNKEI